MSVNRERIISVIIPVYRVEKYLARCIDSVLGQSFQNFELVLVDDGSPDQCGKICDDYAQKDDRIVVLHKENGGLSDARNAGIDWIFKNSHSQWITFIDSDDWIALNTLEILYNAAVNHNVRCAVGNFQRVSTGETSLHMEWDASSESEWDALDLFVEHKTEATTAWAKLYDRALFEELRYPVGRLHEDEFLTYKVLYQAGKVVFVDIPLYQYFYNEESIIHSRYNPKRMDAIDAFEEQRDFFAKIGRSDLARQWDHFVLSECAKHYRALNDIKEKVLMKKLKCRAETQITKMKKDGNFDVIRDLGACECFRPLLAAVIHTKIKMRRFISGSALGKAYRDIKKKL